MFLRPDAKLIHSIGVCEPDKFNLLHDEEQGVEDAVLGGQDPQLLHPIHSDQIGPWCLHLNNDFFLILSVEATRVQVLESIEKRSVCF